MHTLLSKDAVDSILILGKENLLKMVPRDYDRTAGGYKKAFETNFDWYSILMALSECCTNSKRRANKFNWDYNLTLQYLAELWIDQAGKCKVTGIIMSPSSGYNEDKNPYKISVDRIINSQGYIKGNVRLLTHWANNAKSTWTESVFADFVTASSRTLLETESSK